MLTSVLIPLKNDGASVLPMLESLIATTPDGTYEVVIVDRGSTDGTGNLLDQLDGDVTVIRAEPSISLGAAINLAAAAATAPTLVIATANVRFTPDWLSPMMQQLAKLDIAITTMEHVALKADAFRRLGGCVESVADNMVVKDLAMRATATPDAGGDYLHRIVVDSAVEVTNALTSGTSVGDLPLESAERLRDRLQMEEERQLLLAARDGRDVCWTDEGVEEPLVTVRIATKDRSEELMEIALPAAMSQTYENLDIIVVGDYTDDATVKAMQSVTDPRVRFFNLPAAPVYPKDRLGWWRVHGSQAMNLGIELAQGSWITPADDDDAMTPDHVEVMLAEARRRRLEFVWSQTLMETPEGWQILGNEPLGPGATTAGAIMWSSGLRFMRMSTTCWKMNEPHDQNMWRRMHQIGVRMGFLPHVTYRYFSGGIAQKVNAEKVNES